MPIYEFRCTACRRRSSVFVRTVSSPVRAKCDHCGSARMTRLVSKFAVHRAGGGIDLDDPSSLEDIDENDPKAMARWARQMKEEMGEDLGSEFDDMVDRIEAGEDPEEAMAGAGDDDGAFDGDDF
jgi:putative FmdB family regulatory protein